LLLLRLQFSCWSRSPALQKLAQARGCDVGRSANADGLKITLPDEPVPRAVRAPDQGAAVSFFYERAGNVVEDFGIGNAEFDKQFN
jgi:hypothetical protein